MAGQTREGLEFACHRSARPRDRLSRGDLSCAEQWMLEGSHLPGVMPKTSPVSGSANVIVAKSSPGRERPLRAARLPYQYEP